MPAKMLNVFPTIWKQIRARKIPWVPALTAAEQTKLTWAKHIEAYADVPKIYQDFFEPFLTSGQAFPHTVLTPSREGFIDKVTEKLICDFNNEIYILERSGNTFETNCYPIEEISYVEFQTVLLDSRIKISGMTKRGVPKSCIIRFNSVGDYLFTPFLKRIRLAKFNSKDAVQSAEVEKFDHLIRSNYKFMNYARRSLLMGEKVIHFILQPEIRVPVMKILGKTFYRAISPTHMSILTDQELITIREDEPKSRAIGRYGGIWDFIQLNKIVSLTLNRKDNGLLNLSIQLPESVRLDYMFQPSAKQELDQLLDQFKELTTRRAGI